MKTSAGLKQSYLKKLSLLFFALFLMEYLEPSAVGVRAINHFQARGASSTIPSCPISEDNTISTPHAMISMSPFSLEEDGRHLSFYSLPASLSLHAFSKEIFHPPVTLIYSV